MSYVTPNLLVFIIHKHDIRHRLKNRNFGELYTEINH